MTALRQPGTRESLSQSVEFARKRLDRARQREHDALREKALAVASLEIEEARLAAWIQANPEPQMELL
jgi:hypothetical protein